MASSTHTPAFIKAMEEAAKKLNLNPTLLAANPGLQAHLQQIVEAQMLSEESAAASAAASATASAPTSTPPTTSLQDEYKDQAEENHRN